MKTPILSLFLLFNLFTSLAQIPDCSDQALIFSAGSTHQGNYRSSATIQSNGTITDHTKFMAAGSITLLGGFNTPSNLIFIANNEGCNFFSNNWNINNLDPLNFNKIYLPDNYDTTVNFDEDSWIFSTFRSDDKVNMYNEEGPGNPVAPLVLSAPLPQTYNGDMLRIVYSTFNNNTINGAFYHGNSGGTFKDKKGLYLQYDGNEYKQVLGLSYASDAEEEVIAILETISLCLVTEPATIRYDGSPAFDGCGYIITINGQDYKPLNEELIDDSYFTTGNPVDVTLSYTNVSGEIYTCFLPTYYNQITIVSIEYPD